MCSQSCTRIKLAQSRFGAESLPGLAFPLHRVGTEADEAQENRSLADFFLDTDDIRRRRREAFVRRSVTVIAIDYV
jgi:hypothetical protein